MQTEEARADEVRGGSSQPLPNSQPKSQAASPLGQRREPPGRTPDLPPPRVNPEEATPKPKAIPSSEERPVSPVEVEEEVERTPSDSLYGEDLPPDFWDSDPVAEADIQNVAQSEPRADEVDFEPSRRSMPTSAPTTSAPAHVTPRQEVTGKLTDDPRFAVMRSLFPGQIVEWRDSEVADEELSEEGVADPDPDDPSREVDGLN